MSMYTIPLLRCTACGASWSMPKDEPHECAVRAARDERDAWIRLWNRLEAAVSHHKKAKGGGAIDAAYLSDEADEALWKARDRILRDAAPTSKEETST